VTRSLATRSARLGCQEPEAYKEPDAHSLMRTGRLGRGDDGEGGALGGDVALDGDGEPGEVLIADDLAELGARLRASPAARPAQAHVAVPPVLAGLWAHGNP
jgi:hypothetical protein